MFKFIFMNPPTQLENIPRNRVYNPYCPKVIAAAIVCILALSGCTTSLQTEVSEDLDQIPKLQVVAILPVEILQENQKEIATIFRQSLYTNLKHSHFNLIEHDFVDELLEKHKLTEPSEFHSVSPMTFGEILGADGVILTRVNKVERSLIIPSPIELSVSVKMVDTRTGKLIWRAKQTESDFWGIGKIPTSIVTAILSSIKSIAKELDLQELTLKTTQKTATVLNVQEETDVENTFEEPKVSTNVKQVSKEKKAVQKQESEEKQTSEMDTVGKEMEKDKTLKTDSPMGPLEETASNNTPTNKINQAAQSNEKDATTIQQNKNTAKPTNLNKKTDIQTLEFEKDKKSAPSTKKAEAEQKELLKQKETNQPKEDTIQQRENKPINLLYTVQLGAYTNKNFADKVTDGLIKKGYKAFTSTSTNDESNLYKVLVGKFTNKEQATKLSNKIQEKEKIANFIITITPDSILNNKKSRD